MFTGSETFYRHPPNRKVVFTEGAHHVAESRRCILAAR
jgi:hypothetical protein